MNKTITLLLKIVACLTVVGLVLLAIGILGGGIDFISDPEKSKEFFDHYGHVYFEHEFSSHHDKDEQFGDLAAAKESQSFKASEVNDLVISAGAGILTINPSETDEIKVDVSSLNKTSVDLKDGTLIIDSGDINFGDDINITIYLPENHNFGNVDIDYGAGKVNAEAPIMAGDIDINIGAGETVFSNIKTTSLSAKVGAGNIKIIKGDVDDCDIEVDMGQIIYTGFIRGDLDLDCNMGDATLTLSDKETDHNFECDVNAGSLKAGAIHLDGFNSEHCKDNGVKSDYTLDCNMGNIKITFAQ